jgi:radical SAM protein with 4Fe4S-binding SPASM domain
MTAENGFKDHITQLFRQRANDKKKVFSIELLLTNRCHNACPYCGAYTGSKPAEIDFEILRSFLVNSAHHLRGRGIEPVIALCGGDPLKYTFFGNLVLLLNKLKLPFLVKGNPSTMTADRAALLKRSGCIGVKMTLFGNETTHNRNRGPDTLAVLVDKTGLLKSLKIPVIWHLSVGKSNLAETVEMLPFIARVNPDGITMGRIAKMGKLQDSSDFEDLSPAEYRHFLLAILDFYRRHGGNGFNLLFRDKLWVPLLAEEGLLETEGMAPDGPTLGCDAYTNNLTIDNRGNVVPCGGLVSEIIGPMSAYVDAPERLFGQPPLSMQEPSICHSCRYGPVCRGCRAMALANTGGIYNKDPQCWVSS